MQWNNTIGNKQHKVSILHHITAGRWVDIKVDEEPWQLLWQPQLSTIYVRKSHRSIEYCLRLKKISMSKDPEDFIYSIQTEADLDSGLEASLNSISLHVLEWDSRNKSRQDKPVKLRSPMVGKILNILVSDSDEVKKGQELLVIEAMKMENKITAPCDGIIEKLKVSIGQQIAIQDDMLTIKKKLI